MDGRSAHLQNVVQRPAHAFVVRPLPVVAPAGRAGQKRGLSPMNIRGNKGLCLLTRTWLEECIAFQAAGEARPSFQPELMHHLRELAAPVISLDLLRLHLS